jgi:hypothetical protein
MMLVAKRAKVPGIEAQTEWINRKWYHVIDVFGGSITTFYLTNWMLTYVPVSQLSPLPVISSRAG